MSTTFLETIRRVLNAGRTEQLPAGFSKVKLGNMLSVVKVTVSALTPAGTHDITTATFKNASTITGLNLDTGENLPAIGKVISLRVTAATTGSTVGSYGVTDASGTAVTANTSSVMGIATLSDDGKTLGFPTADVTAFVLVYEPRAATDPGTEFAT